MKRLVIAALVVAAFTMTGSAFAGGPGGGGGAGNTAGQQCKNSGYLSLVGTSGPFTTQAACVSYAVNGGTTYSKTATLTATSSTGPVTGLGALVGNPQSRTVGGITDPAMQINVGGTGWVPGQTVSLSYTAAAPLSYTYANPTSYFPTAPALVANSSTSISSFFQDNCFDNNNVLVSGNVNYTLTASNSVGQSATKSGTLNCSAIGATVLASTGPAVGNGDVYINAQGWGFKPNTQLTDMTYTVQGFADGGPYQLQNYTTLPTTDANGHFTFQWDGDNCIYGGIQQTTDQTFTMQVSDGTNTASVTGVLKCSLLAP